MQGLLGLQPRARLNPALAERQERRARGAARRERGLRLESRRQLPPASPTSCWESSRGIAMVGRLDLPRARKARGARRACFEHHRRIDGRRWIDIGALEGRHADGCLSSTLERKPTALDHSQDGPTGRGTRALGPVERGREERSRAPCRHRLCCSWNVARSNLDDGFASRLLQVREKARAAANSSARGRWANSSMRPAGAQSERSRSVRWRSETDERPTLKNLQSPVGVRSQGSLRARV
jgi:hypothetical protein